MTARQTVEKWVNAFNSADVEALENLYAADAVNHQMPNEPVDGREAIALMFRKEFGKADMHCIPINIFEDGDHAILEWKDPKGFRGCGFFHVISGQIVSQRGYWDKLSFMKLYNLE